MRGNTRYLLILTAQSLVPTPLEPPTIHPQQLRHSKFENAAHATSASWTASFYVLFVNPPAPPLSRSSESFLLTQNPLKLEKSSIESQICKQIQLEKDMVSHISTDLTISKALTRESRQIFADRGAKSFAIHRATATLNHVQGDPPSSRLWGHCSEVSRDPFLS